MGYAVVGTVVYCLCVSVGEMIAFLYVAAFHSSYLCRSSADHRLIRNACHRPNVGGVVGLADLYVDPALGFSLGWAAWVRIIDIYRI